MTDSQPADGSREDLHHFFRKLDRLMRRLDAEQPHRSRTRRKPREHSRGAAINGVHEPSERRIPKGMYA